MAIFNWNPDLTTPLLAALVFWWAPLPFLWLFNKIAGMGQHDLEYACDAVAAEVVGAESKYRPASIRGQIRNTETKVCNVQTNVAGRGAIGWVGPWGRGRAKPD